MMNKAKSDLLNGTITYFVGNALVALIQLVLLRFVTGKLLPSDYGYYNLIITIEQLVTPIVTLQISDAVFRFFFDDNKYRRETIYSNTVVVLVASFVVIAVACVVCHLFIFPIRNIFYVILYMICTSIFAIYQKITRAMGYSVEFIKCNLLKAFLYIFIQIVCLYVFDLKIESLFISFILSTMISVLILEIKVKQYRFIDFKCFDFAKLKEMVAFSAPLVPNSICWWLNSSVNAMILTQMVSLSANGIYSVAVKFAHTLNIVVSVFSMAWQESAIKEVDSSGRNKFYNETYNLFLKLLFLAIAVAIPLIKIVMPYMIDVDYYEALKYAPLLLMATGFSAVSGFFGQMYTATKETKGAMYTTIVGVAVNLTVSFALISRFKIWAVVIATIMSNLVLALIRYYKFRKVMELYTDLKEQCFGFLATAISLLMYFGANSIVNIAYLVIIAVLTVLFNRKMIQDFVLNIFEKIKNKVEI